MFRRENYCFNDLIGELGGVFEVMVFVVGIVMMPLSEHAFIIEVLERNFSIYQKESLEARAPGQQPEGDKRAEPETGNAAGFFKRTLTLNRKSMSGSVEDLQKSKTEKQTRQAAPAYLTRMIKELRKQDTTLSGKIRLEGGELAAVYPMHASQEDVPPAEA